MRRQIIKEVLVVLLCGAGLVGSAFADEYHWTLSGGGVNGSGLLTTGSPDNGGFDVLTFTGVVNGSSVALYGGQPGTNGAQGPPGVYYNNIIYPSMSSNFSACGNGTTLVDDCGLAFTEASGIGSVYTNDSGIGTGAYVYEYAVGNSVSNDFNANFAITPYVAPAATPEPGSILLLGTGLALLGVTKLRRFSPFRA